MEPQLVFLSSLKNSKSNKKGLIFMKRFFALMLVTLLITSVLMLTSCGYVEYDIEVNSHKDFVNNIDNYNSLHDFYVDTFISFDLDENEMVSKSIYYVFTLMPLSSRNFLIEHGYICDIHNDGLAQILVFYLRGENESSSDRAYKIKCSFSKVPFNYTSEDEIKITNSNCTYYSENSTLRKDEFYEDTLLTQAGIEEKDRIYNHVYHYSLCVNDVQACCIHISSIDEASEEKLNEIIDMLYDSLVVLNTEEVFIWRDKE